MMSVRIDNLSINLGAFSLKEVCLDIKAGEYFTLLGPTGAGKAVLIETIAGLHTACMGRIFFNGTDVTRMAPERRGAAVVYQDHALFPHLSVAANIEFGLKCKGESRKERYAVRERLVDLLGIGHLVNRNPRTLSGGERQKVALARALAIQPKVLLLDEPFSSLDQKARHEMRNEMKRLRDRLDVTVIHVTHDFDEAISLGHRIAVMGEGTIRQVGIPDEIFRCPNSEFVARFTMTRNIFHGSMLPTNGRAVFQTGSLELIANRVIRGASTACVRPEAIQIAPGPRVNEGPNCFSGIVSRVDRKSTNVEIMVSVPDEFCCSVSYREFTGMAISEGDLASISFSPGSVHVF